MLSDSISDINFYQEESEDTPEDRYGLEGGNCGESFCSDDNLTALQKLEKYMDSDNAFSRQLLARGILETLRAAGSVEEDCIAVLQAMVRLSSDVEPTVRSDLVEQVPHVAMYCQENRNFLPNAVATYILPLVVKYLSDNDNQVRKTSHAALVVLLEQELVERVDVEDQVVQVLLDLAGPGSPDEFRTEAAALMCKMAPLLGREMTECLFLAHFTQMCIDPLFHVRQICACNFGEMCAVVGGESTEYNLLGRFSSLCEDGVWGVRKGCAESFMAVASVCSVEVRRNMLTSLFVSLLCDRSRWVRMSAFQQLGPFISTFSSPNNESGLYVSEDGVLHVSRDLAERNLTDAEKEAKLSCDRAANNTKQTMPMSADPSLQEISKTSESTTSCQTEADILSSSSSSSSSCDMTTVEQNCDSPLPQSSDPIQEQMSQPSAAITTTITTDDTVSSPDSFNTFQFWRTPLPELNIELDLLSKQSLDQSMLPGISSDSSALIYSLSSSMDHPELGSGTHCVSEQLLSSLAEMELGSMSSDFPPNSQSVSRAEAELRAARIIHTASISTVYNPSETVSDIGSTHVFGHHMNDSTKIIVGGLSEYISSSNIPGYGSDSSSSSIHQNYDSSSTTNPDNPINRITELCAQQEIVPPRLLENFLTMVDPALSQSVDSDITRHCAYNFPAVAYTLGRHNWHCLKSLFETLAADMQWKVRRTLAFSIHELAVILGEDITHKDLVPVFDGFLKDLDEVRIGVLKHLMEFLKLLKPSVRNEYLPKVQNFLTTDNHRNWRFRLELAEQCEPLCNLFHAQENSAFLLPIALALLNDKVAEVRLAACSLVSTLLKQLHDSHEQYYQNMVMEVINCFAASHKWATRQVFAQLCWSILEDKSIPAERFARDFLPSLLNLANDVIPNVRITSSKTLSQCVLSVDYFVSPQNPYYEKLVETMLKLQVDKDKDVRYFSAMAPNKFQKDSQDENDCQDTVPFHQDNLEGFRNPNSLLSLSSQNIRHVFAEILLQQNLVCCIKYFIEFSFSCLLCVSLSLPLCVRASLSLSLPLCVRVSLSPPPLFLLRASLSLSLPLCTVSLSPSLPLVRALSLSPPSPLPSLSLSLSLPLLSLSLSLPLCACLSISLSPLSLPHGVLSLSLPSPCACLSLSLPPLCLSLSLSLPLFACHTLSSLSPLVRLSLSLLSPLPVRISLSLSPLCCSFSLSLAPSL
ncbi:PPP4R1 [Acanthosepion pharaonis]|uniref:PPP4R1 n=1 Tax=Acanthosepion pharaonis TaxID=158019 RepID=A0A812DIJ5_ACAPH|nr:PPP4R1 [Sepia pharaonis]